MEEDQALLYGDPPPPYEEIFSGYHFDDTSALDDGRVDVDVRSRLSLLLARRTPKEGPQPALPPKETASVSPCKVRLNVVIQIAGSRGDVQPFVALGCELQKHGHRIRLATHNVFEAFVREAGLKFYPIGGDPAELMAYIVKNPGLIPSMKSLKAGDIQRKRAMVAEMLEGCWKSCIEPDPVTNVPFVADAIIANPPSFAHVHCAQALGIPVHMMFTMPWSSTRAFPHPFANLKHKEGTDPKIANYVSYGIVEFLTWQGLGHIVNKWRRNSLALESVPFTEGALLAESLKVPHTYCWSPALVPKPFDWPSHLDVSGFFFREAPAYEPSPDLAAFLNKGPTPIYVGFGSIVINNSEEVIASILAAVRATGVRAIILRGWSNLGKKRESDDNIFYLGDCPHEWLFRHVSVVTHHGGAGTTACGLLNARPTVIVPFFGDQPFWGRMVATAGAGPRPIPRRALNSFNLTEAIKFCLQKDVAEAASHLAEKMRKENGIKAAVVSFHSHLPKRLSESCDIVPGEVAAWKYKAGKTSVLLSKRAAQLLIQQTKIDSKRLKSLETNPIYIENRRWDPVTALSSALLSTTTNMAVATGSIFVSPYKEYQKSRNRPTDIPAAGETSATASILLAERAQLLTPSILQRPTSAQGVRGERSPTANMALASATGVGSFFLSYVKGFFVDIPLAATEGMRALPRIYGEQPKDYSHVRDWKSGAVVAGKTFSQGIYEGFTDIFTETYKRKKAEGALGTAKGLGKGLVNLTMITGACAVGLIAYPGQGVYKSLRAASMDGAKKRIREAKIREGEWLVTREDEKGSNMDAEVVVSMFECFEISVLLPKSQIR